MFPSQMVCLKIVEPSSSPLCPCFLCKCTPQNCRTLKLSTLSMFPSQMVYLKIVEPSGSPLCPCFPRKWYASKLLNPQAVHFVHVSLANGTPQNCRTLKWSTLSMSASQIVRLKIVEPSSGQLCPCFQSQMVRLVEPSSGPLCPCFQLQMVCLKIVEPSSGPVCPCFPCK